MFLWSQRCARDFDSFPSTTRLPMLTINLRGLWYYTCHWFDIPYLSSTSPVPFESARAPYNPITLIGYIEGSFFSKAGSNWRKAVRIYSEVMRAETMFKMAEASRNERTLKSLKLCRNVLAPIARIVQEFLLHHIDISWANAFRTRAFMPPYVCHQSNFRSKIHCILIHIFLKIKIVYILC